MKPVAYVAVESAVQLGAVTAAAVGVGLADLTVPEGAITGGVIGAVVVLIGAVVNAYLRIRKDTTENKTARAEADQIIEDKQVARDRKIRRDALDEWQQTVADLRSDRELDRKEIHELRNSIHTEKMARVLAEARLTECEKDRAELFRRVEALENRE